MGLFDQLAGMAGGMMGGDPRGEGAAGGAAAGGGLGAIVQMLQNQGGVGAVLGKFEESGLGGVASSWRAEGANAPVSPDQVQAALGSGPIAEVAQKLRIDPGEAAAHISQYLPQIMDHLTPGGQPAEGGALDGLLGGLMSRFGGPRPD